jgi:very-short-patch-repair endonuclease
LIDNNLNSIDWGKLNPEGPFYFFVPKNNDNKEEYEKGFLLQELFPVNSNGLFTARDNFTVHFTKEQAINIITEFLSLDNETARKRFELGEDVRDWSVAGARRDLSANPDFNKIVKINYRPFDIRYTYFTGTTKGFHCMPRGKFMKHFIQRDNLGLIIGRQGQSVGAMEWNLVSVTSTITDLNIYYRGGGLIFPLYLYHEHFGQMEKVANLNKAIVAKFPSKGGVPEGRGGRNTQNYMQLPYNSSLKERARELRKAGNLSEVLFWNKVKNKQFKGYDFDRQKIVGNYIVDFFCTNCNVVIEIDGSSHDNKQEYDAARDAFLQSVGLTVIHIPDIDIKKRLDNVMEMLHSHAALQPPPAFSIEDKTTPPCSIEDKTTPPFGHPSKEGELCPEQIFDYVYAVLHSPSYREKYKEFLKIDFPRIPYPKNAEQFEKLVAFGERLRHLHLMEFPPLLWIGAGGEVANFPKSGNNRVENSFTQKSNDYHDCKVWINDAQYFDNVPSEAWNFYIGGYQPAQKWLKDRKGRTLTYEDIEHYRKIIFALNETDRIMNEIDLAL